MTEAAQIRDEIFTTLRGYLVALFDIPEDDVKMDADLAEDLDLDSIDAVDLMVKIQELTGKKMAPEDFKSVRSVSDVVDRVEELMAENRV